MIRWYAKWQRQNADALKDFIEKHKVNVLKTPHRGQHRLPQDLGQDRGARGREGSVLQEGARIAAGSTPSVVVPAKRFLFPAYDFAANHYWPEKKAAAAAEPAAAKPADKQ